MVACKFLFLVLYIISVMSFGVPYVAADDYVKMLDDMRQKDSIAKLFRVSGQISDNFADMTVTYPDESVMKSSVSVTDRGYFQTFVMLEPADPAGLYMVVIHPYNDTAVSPLLRTSFFLSDYDGLVDIHIKRNSVIACNGISQYCVEPNITHIPKSFAVRFFNDDYDNHQMKIGSVTGDLILPGGDSIIYPQKTGTIEYNCVIHPWIDGKLHVTDVSSIKYIYETTHTSIPIFDNTQDTIQSNTLQFQYNVNDCGMCYVGVVTKIVDGDTIYVDKKPVRLALVNTPEKRQTGYDDATSFVLGSCPIGSQILVDVDDILSTDELGVNFAKITCGNVNVNESLMKKGLARMYDSFCTESEFMYEAWATHNCDKPKTIIEHVIPDVVVVTPNSTIVANYTIPIENISKDNSGIIYIVAVFIVLLICLILWYHKKNQSSQNTSFPNTVWLE